MYYTRGACSAILLIAGAYGIADLTFLGKTGYIKLRRIYGF